MSRPLTLRRWRLADVGLHARFVAESRDHLERWLSWMEEEPRSVAARRDLIRGWEWEWAAGGDVQYAAFAERTLVGGALLRWRGPRVLEIGYWLHPAHLGRGYATIAAGLLTDTGLAQSEVVRVEIHHDKANVASAGVPRRLGFRFIGETPDRRAAPAELGIDWGWVMDAERWLDSRPRPLAVTGSGPRILGAHRTVEAQAIIDGVPK